MVLYLNEKEAQAVIEALKLLIAQGDVNVAKILIARVDQCLALQGIKKPSDKRR